jgi:hypothetical protein
MLYQVTASEIALFVMAITYIWPRLAVCPITKGGLDGSPTPDLPRPSGHTPNLGLAPRFSGVFFLVLAAREWPRRSRRADRDHAAPNRRSK